MARFTAKTVVVTGAAGGIGSRLAALLRAEGAHLVLHDLSADALAALPAELALDRGGDLGIGLGKGRREEGIGRGSGLGG